MTRIAKIAILLTITEQEVLTMSREKVYNFSAGPSMMPESVLNKAGSEISDYKGSGMSVM